MAPGGRSGVDPWPSAVRVGRSGSGAESPVASRGTRGRARDRPGNVRPGRLGFGRRVGSGGWPEPVAAGACRRIGCGGWAGRITWSSPESSGSRGRGPPGRSRVAEHRNPGIGWRRGAWATLRWARRRPSSISHSAEARAESSVASGVLSHKPSRRGYLLVFRHLWPGAS